jgi:hypothetical protein
VNKKTMIYGGAGLALVVLFLYLRSRSSSSSSAAPTDTVGTPQDQTASDYANLAGSLQGVGAQEQSDIGTLGGQFAAFQGQEASDIAGLQGQIAGLGGGAATTAPVDSVQAPDIARGPDLAAVMAGQKSLAKELKALNNKVNAKNRQTTSGHSNNHHPAGTAGHSVGSRSHAPKTGTGATYTPSRTHAQPPHAAPTRTAAKKPPPPKPTKRRGP